MYSHLYLNEDFLKYQGIWCTLVNEKVVFRVIDDIPVALVVIDDNGVVFVEIGVDLIDFVDSWRSLVI
jgi:hypothetical protein